MTLKTTRDTVIDTQRPRRESTVVDLVIIHAMSEYVVSEGNTIFALDFLNEIQLGCHYFIAPDGLVLNGVNPDFRTPHVGRSELGGRKWLNETSIGIEFLVPGVNTYSKFLKTLNCKNPFTSEQYTAGAGLVAKLKKNFPEIDKGHRVVGHDNVSGDDVRGEGRGKKDPGSKFDWGKLNSLTGHFGHHMKPSEERL